MIIAMNFKRIRRYKREHQNHKIWGRGVRKFGFFLIMCFSLNDYELKASRHSNGSIRMNFMVTINQKFTIDSQKPERKGLKHTTTKIHHITKGKTTKKK